MTDELADLLIHEIWKTSPFPESTIREVYKKHKSIDKTIDVLNVAHQSGVDPLSIIRVKVG